MSLQDRIFGIETEYAINFYSKDAIRDPETKTIVQALQEIFLTKRYGISGCNFLVTGAKFYHDVGHAEWALPECRSAREAAAYDKAADHLLAQILPETEQVLLQKGYQGKLLIVKNNIDSKGHTYGCHENYLMMQDTELLVGDHFLRYLIRHLTPFLVTRQIFTGAGHVVVDDLNSRQQPTFELSQRTPFINSVVSKDTMKERPIINLGREHEPLASGNYRRLHLILGDANLSGWATWIKLGTTGIVLRMIEDMFITDIPLLQDPLMALGAISRDLSCSTPVPLRDGRQMGAIDIQWRYFELADVYLKHFGFCDEEHALMEAWKSALEDIRLDPMKLRNRVDWVMKKRVLDAYLVKRGLSWEKLPREKAIRESLQAEDLRYHDISRVGLFNRLCYPDTLITEEEIHNAQNSPPQYTRAKIRGEALVVAQRYNIPVNIENWTDIHIYGQKIGLPDPFDFDHCQLTDQLLSQLEGTIKKNPNDAQFYAQLGLIYLFNENYEKALNAYNKAIALKPEQTDFATALASILLIQGEYDAAFQWYEKANQLIKNKEKHRCISLDEAYYFGQHEKTIQAYQKQLRLKLINIHPELLTHLYFGLVFLKTGQIDYAERHLQIASEQSGGDYISLTVLGIICLSRGFQDRATTLLQSVLSLWPERLLYGLTLSDVQYFQAMAHLCLGSEHGLSLLKEALGRQNLAAAVLLLDPLMGLLAKVTSPSRDLEQALTLIQQTEQSLLQDSNFSRPRVHQIDYSWVKKALQQKNSNITVRTIKSLARQKDVESLSILMDLTRGNESVHVRRSAVEALGYRADKAAMKALIVCLRDPSQVVQWAAEKALERVTRGVSVQLPVVSSGSNDVEPLIQIIS